MIKLQHMSVIFVIIMIPIVLVLSFYIATQIDTINLQTQYNTKLNDATHDAMEAFQINTRNNEYSTVADSLKRDVSAAVNTFYTSLASNMGVSGQAREELQPYIPAVLCTMYDGFYLSSPTKTQAGAEPEDMLKQYTYYTARYINDTDDTDVTINYSLDSYISVYGKVNGEYVSRAGYLIQHGSKGLTEINVENTGNILNDCSVYDYNKFNYYDDSKTYKIKDGMIWDSTGNTQIAIKSVVYNDQQIDTEANVVVKNESNQYEKKINSKEALYYFLEAYEFSKYMEKIGLEYAINNAKEIRINDNTIYDGSNNKITKPNVKFIDEDPENLSSGLVTHKRDIIRYCIENSLQTAFNNFEGTYDYQLPKLKEQDWEKIYKNVSVVTFMQGIQVGSKMYNNYSIVTSTGNEEYIDPEEIYFVDGSSSSYYRIEKASENSTGYRSNMYLQQSKITKKGDNGQDEDVTNSGYILKEVGGKTEVFADYKTIVNSEYNSVYDEDGNLLGGLGDNTPDKEKKKVYYTALARERYCLVRSKATSILNTSQTIRGSVYASGEVIDSTTGNVSAMLSNLDAFPNNEYTLVSVKESNGTETNTDKTGEQYATGESVELELEPNKEYTVTVQAIDKYGKIKTDTVKLNTGAIIVNTETNWENGYLKFTASTSRLKTNQKIKIDYTGEKNGARVTLPVYNRENENYVSVEFLDPQEIGLTENYPNDYLKISIEESGVEKHTQYATPSGIDKEGPTILLKKEDIKIEEEKINFYILAKDDKSGFVSENDFDIQIFEVGNDNALEGIYINKNTTLKNYNEIESNIEITGLKPNTEYYLIIKSQDRIGNLTILDTRDGEYNFSTKYKPEETVPDASIIIKDPNLEPDPEIDPKYNIIAWCKPTYWIDGENEVVTVTLETVNLSEEYYVEYISKTDYEKNLNQAWKKYETPITVTENEVYYVRLAKEVDGKKIIGNQTTLNIQNIDKEAPIISWWRNDSVDYNHDIELKIEAKDNQSGLKSFIIDGQECLPQNSYNEETREGIKEFQHTIVVSENTTIEVETVDGVGRIKKETIEVKNINKTAPKVEVIGVTNSNQIDPRYANKGAIIELQIKAEDDNLQNKAIDVENIVLKVGGTEIQVFEGTGQGRDRTADANTSYTQEVTIDGKMVQTHIIELYNITGNGLLEVELKEGAIKDTAGNTHNTITYNTGIIMDNIAPKVNLETNIANKKASIKVNATDEASGIYNYRYSILDKYDLKKELYEKNGTDIYSFDTSFGIYLLNIEVTDKAGNNVIIDDAQIKDYSITTKEEMVYFQKYVDLGTTFETERINLLNDINLEGSQNNQWDPIGTDTYNFKGIFEGNDNTISGIYINKSTANQGLFYKNEGTIRRLTIEGNIKSTSYVGGIAAINAGTIEKCNNKANIIATNEGAGGITGLSLKDSNITECTNEGEVTSAKSAGGIVGKIGEAFDYLAGNVIITKCINNGIVENGKALGGIVGNTFIKAKVTKCFNTATIEGVSAVGGIIGNNKSGSLVSECYNKGNVKASTYVGGIAGVNGNIEETYDKSSVELNKGRIESCYNIGEVTANSFVGGIAGTNSYIDGTVETAIIENCYNAGKVATSQDGNQYIGAVVGNTKDIESITNTYYLEGCALKGIGEQDDKEAVAEVKSQDEMKAPQFVKTLGIEYWKEDHTQQGRVQINNGYPILKWQEGKETVIITAEKIEHSKIQISAEVTNIKVNSSEETQYQYYIKENVDDEYTLKETISSKNYTFKGLKQNKTYYIKVVATNNEEVYDDINNGIYEGETVVTTGKWTIKKGDIKFTAMPSNWTNTNVTVIMQTPTEHKMQYQIGKTGEWKDYTQSFEVDKNTVIFGRLVDSEGEATYDYATFNVSNIDKISPTVDIVKEENITDLKEVFNIAEREKKASVYTVVADTSWYNSSKTEFTLRTANQFVGFLELIKQGNSFSGKTIYLGVDVNLNNIELQINEGVFSGTLEGTEHAIHNINVKGAGLICETNEGTIKNLILASGKLVATASNSGSIVGLNKGAIINCYNLGVNIPEVENGVNSIGGIAGNNKISALIRNCYNMEDIVIDCGKEDTTLVVGGITGGADFYTDKSGTVQNCYNMGNIRVSNTSNPINYNNGVCIGGIIGSQRREGVTENCYNLGNITVDSIDNSDNRFGGIGGQLSGDTKINNCHNLGKITIKNTNDADVGGVVGYVGKRSPVLNCSNRGEITMEASGGYNTHVGGVIGRVYTPEHGSIEKCFNTGNITSNARAIIGGIVGYTQCVYLGVRNCYNTGNITSTAGDLAGIICADVSWVNSCYNIGKINLEVYTVGKNGYYLEGTITAPAEGTYGTPMTEAQMKDPSFVTTLGESSWKQDTKGINDGYPILKWQEEVETTPIFGKKAKINVQDKESGIKYWGVTKSNNPPTQTSTKSNITKTSETDLWFELPNTTQITEVEFKTLNQGRYYIWGKDLAGNVNPISIFEYYDLQNDITISEPIWENGKASVTIETNQSQLQLQTSKDSENWVTQSSNTVTLTKLTNGTTIYAKLTDGEHYSGTKILTIEDRIEPEVTFSVSGAKVENEEIYQRKVSIAASTLDEQTGLEKLSLTIQRNGEDIETLEETVQEGIFKNQISLIKELTGGGKYIIKITATDKAGNETTTEKTFEIARDWMLNEGDIKFTAMPSNWTNTNVTVIMQTPTEHNMQYQIGTTDGDWQNYTQSFEVDKNTVIYARLIDENGSTTYDYATFNVSNIDKISPTVDIVKEENNIQEREKTASEYTGMVDTSWYEETKTEFTLTTADQFVGFLAMVEQGTYANPAFSGKKVYLGADINLNDREIPIHQGVFGGTFDGQEHTVYNINLTNGLIYENQGIIQNLIMVSGKVNPRVFGPDHDIIAGTISAINHRRIEKCYNLGIDITFYGPRNMYIGGITGINYSSLANCYNAGNIVIQSGDTDTNIDVRVGGIAGGTRQDDQVEPKVDNSYNIGDITIKNFKQSVSNSGEAECRVYVGGIIGNVYHASNCYNMGNITLTNIQIPGGLNIDKICSGGIVGTMTNNIGMSGNFDDCHNCHNFGNITVDKISQDSYWRGYHSVTIGGVIGSAYWYDYDITVNQCSSTGEIKLSDVKHPQVGGIIGLINVNPDIKLCYNKSNITISNCDGEAAFNATNRLGFDGVGGIIGTISKVEKEEIMKYCYNVGNIIISESDIFDVGGLIGSMDAIYGYNYSKSTSYCYNAGKVDLEGNRVLLNPNRVSLGANGYYLEGTITGAIEGDEIYGTPMTEAQMKDPSFVTTLGKSIWKQDTKGINNGYPILAWQEEVETTPIFGKKAKINVQDKESGIKYWGVTNSNNPPTQTSTKSNITKTSETDLWFELPNTTQITEVEFKTLNQGTYYIWAKDLAGNISEISKFEYYKLTNDITFSSPTWTNGKASVTIETSQTNLQIQTSTDNTNWTTQSGNPVNIRNLKNGSTLYARLTDGSYYSTTSEVTIQDTTKPVATIAIAGTKVENENKYLGDISVTASATDNQTGIAKVSMKIQKDGYDIGPFEKTVQEGTYKASASLTKTLTSGGNYTIEVTIADKAGNENTTTIRILVIKICDYCEGMGSCRTCFERGALLGKCENCYGNGYVGGSCNNCYSHGCSDCGYTGKKAYMCYSCEGTGNAYTKCNSPLCDNGMCIMCGRNRLFTILNQEIWHCDEFIYY